MNELVDSPRNWTAITDSKTRNIFILDVCECDSKREKLLFTKADTLIKTDADGNPADI